MRHCFLAFIVLLLVVAVVVLAVLFAKEKQDGDSDVTTVELEGVVARRETTAEFVFSDDLKDSTSEQFREMEEAFCREVCTIYLTFYFEYIVGKG